MQATLHHPLVKPLAFVSAVALAATLVAVASGPSESASAVGPNHTTELAYGGRTPGWECPAADYDLGTFYTANYQKLRIVGRSIAQDSGPGADFTLTFTLADDGYPWEIGRLKIPAGTTKSTVIDVPGRSLTISAACTGPSGASGEIGVLAYGN